MQFIKGEQVADFFELMTIQQSIDISHTITHICNAGVLINRAPFVIINDSRGRSVVAPACFNYKTGLQEKDNYFPCYLAR